VSVRSCEDSRDTQGFCLTECFLDPLGGVPPEHLTIPLRRLMREAAEGVSPQNQPADRDGAQMHVFHGYLLRLPEWRCLLPRPDEPGAWASGRPAPIVEHPNEPANRIKLGPTSGQLRGPGMGTERENREPLPFPEGQDGRISIRESHGCG